MSRSYNCDVDIITLFGVTFSSPVSIIVPALTYAYTGFICIYVIVMINLRRNIVSRKSVDLFSEFIGECYISKRRLVKDFNAPT